MIPTIAVILTDASRKIQWVNEDFTKITGYELWEVVGKKPGAVLQGAASEGEVVRRIRRNLDAMIPFKDQLTNYRKNGEAYQCRLVIHPVFNREKKLTNFIAFEIDADQTDDADLPLMQLDNKYQTSSLKGPLAARLFLDLKAMIEEEALYLNPAIHLKELADRLNTNTKYLSQVVNFHAGQNLQVFINAYRVKEAKSRLKDKQYKHLTLYGIAMLCGFKNKSTFYKVFKAHTGMTPMEYLKTA
ncbi:MAG: helix-turn-helix domain-containing protein [Phaeodactylibacter sp.]|nr:helix-turn-helix domain-containing protein [Phaeodactylibacter sp.]